MILDAHQHFWIYEPASYPWISNEMAPLRRDYLPPDLEHAARPHGVEGSVAVQARQSLEESRFLLGLADQSPFVRGVVGWVDLQGDDLAHHLRELSAHEKFLGVRHVVQDEPDERFMLRPQFLAGLGALREFDLTYDLLIFPQHLPIAIDVVGRFPEQPFVLDHLAKPVIRRHLLAPWKDHLRELARHPHVYCKLSGLVTEAGPAWQRSDFRPYLDAAVEAFGEDRLMFGSDWPVCLLASDYAQVHELIHDYIGDWPAEARRKVWGENARRFYGV